MAVKDLKYAALYDVYGGLLSEKQSYALEMYYCDDLSLAEIAEHIGIMTKRWLREHGDMLPRTRVTWTDGKGQQHTSSWMYPLHRIQAMIEDGRISRLKVS